MLILEKRALVAAKCSGSPSYLKRIQGTIAAMLHHASAHPTDSTDLENSIVSELAVSSNPVAVDQAVGTITNGGPNGPMDNKQGPGKDLENSKLGVAKAAIVGGLVGALITAGATVYNGHETNQTAIQNTNNTIQASKSNAAASKADDENIDCAARINELYAEHKNVPGFVIPTTDPNSTLNKLCNYNNAVIYIMHH